MCVFGKVLCLALIGFSLSSAQNASSPTPFIQSIFPRGGQQGAELRIEIGGRNLAGASEVRVSGGGVTCQVLEASEAKITAQVKIAADAPLGRRDLRVLTPRGSFVQGFEVGALPERMEPESNNDWPQAPLVQLPIVINGKITSGDYDYFRFAAKAGQVLVFDLNSSRTGTRFDGVLSLLDHKGRELAEQDDYYFDKDPHLLYRFTEAGEYLLRAWGFRESGSEAAEYRLLMGELPSLHHVFPAGGRRGEMVEFVLAGQNLSEVESFLLDQTRVNVQFIDKREDQLKFRMRIPPGLAPGYYPLRVRVGNTDMPNPLTLAVSDTAEIALSSESRAEPLPLRIPVIVNGRLARPRQRDLFWLDVEAGEQITFQGEGMVLGNFLDPAVTVYDTAGNVVAYMDETAPNGFDKEPPNLDFYLVHRFEKAGRYRVEMRDAGLRGREDLIYRLQVSHSDPDFQVSVLAPQVTVLQGSTATFAVRVRRLGGWDTPVEVWVENTPPGVKSKPVATEPVNTRFRGTFGEDFFFDGTNVDVPLQAQEGTPPGVYSLRIKAKGTIHNKTVERTALVFHHWYQTGFLRGPTQEQQFLMTVSKPSEAKPQEQASDSVSK